MSSYGAIFSNKVCYKKGKKEAFHGLQSGSNMFHTGMIQRIDKARWRGGGASYNGLYIRRGSRRKSYLFQAGGV